VITSTGVSPAGSPVRYKTELSTARPEPKLGRASDSGGVALQDLAAWVLVALVAQELDAYEDCLLDLVAERSGGGRVVIAGTKASRVDRVAEPEVEALGRGIGVGPTPRTIGGVGNPMSFS